MIYIKEDIPVKLPGETSLFVSFDYNPDIVKVIKTLDNPNWNKKLKVWEIYATELYNLIDSLSYLDDITLDLYDWPDSEWDLEHKVNYKIPPFKHQLEAIEKGINNQKWLLLDGMGLGKTKSMLHVAEELKARDKIEHCLIICGINSLKTNWKKEVLFHTNEEAIILGERKNRNGKTVFGSIPDRASQLMKPIDEFFVITNIESLRYSDVVNAINRGANKFDLILIDEGHKIKNHDSDQAKGIEKLYSKYKILATGTLITNTPLDAYMPLTWVGANKALITEFKKYYCIYDYEHKIVGYKNMDVLIDQLNNHSLRRTKDILDLPPKNIIHEVLDVEDKHKKLYDEVKEGIRNEVDKVTISKHELGKFVRLQQASVCPKILTTKDIRSTKLDRACELVDEILQNAEEKVVIFSQFKEPVYELSKMLEKYNPLIGTGDIPDMDIQNNIDKFQSDDRYKVFIGTISKMGTGFTLTRASYAIFVDCTWISAINQQAEDRIYRIGTEKPVFIYYLWNNNTIDMRVKRVVENKEQIANYMQDGKLPDESKMTSTMRNMLDDIYKHLYED